MISISIGSELANARKTSGLTLENVADKSKLRVNLILLLEKGDFSQCGGDVYARGHIRVLANLYRVDCAYLLKLFDDKFGTFRTALDELAITNSQNLERKNSFTWKSLSVAASVLAIIVVVIFQSEGTQSVREIAASPGASPSSTTPEPSQSLTAVATADKGVTVRLSVLKSYSWISATAADGSALFTGQIGKGESKEFFDAQLLRLVIGNAGALTLTVNGVERGVPGAIGEVLRLEFKPDGEDSAG